MPAELKSPHEVEDKARPSIDLPSSLQKNSSTGVEILRLQKRLYDKEDGWEQEKAELLKQLERTREQLRQKDAELKEDKEQRILKVAQDEIANFRVHKLIEINTLARLVKESLALAEKYKEDVGKGNTEETGSELELQVLKSAFEYARKEIYDLGATREQLRDEFRDVEEDSHMCQEKELLYKAIGDAEKEIQSIRNAPEDGLAKIMVDGLPDQSPDWDLEFSFKQIKQNSPSKPPDARKASMSPAPPPGTPIHSIDFSASSLNIKDITGNETDFQSNTDPLNYREESFLVSNGRPSDERHFKPFGDASNLITPLAPSTPTNILTATNMRKLSGGFDDLSRPRNLSVGSDGIFSPAGILSPSKYSPPSRMTSTPGNLISQFTPSGEDLPLDIFSWEDVKAGRCLEPNLESLQETLEEDLSNQESSDEKLNDSDELCGRDSSGDDFSRRDSDGIEPTAETGNEPETTFGDDEQESTLIDEDSLLHIEDSFLFEKAMSARSESLMRLGETTFEPSSISGMSFDQDHTRTNTLQEDLLGGNLDVDYSNSFLASAEELTIPEIERRSSSTDFRSLVPSPPSKPVMRKTSDEEGSPQEEKDIPSKKNKPERKSQNGTNQDVDTNEEQKKEGLKPRLAQIDSDKELNPLPNVLKHNEKETERVGKIRKLMGSFRRAKKSMACLSELLGKSSAYGNLVKGTGRSFTDLVGNANLQASLLEKSHRSRHSTLARTTLTPKHNVSTSNVSQGPLKGLPGQTKTPGLTFPGSELLQKIPDAHCSQKVQHLAFYSKTSYEKLAQLEDKQRKSRKRLWSAFELLKRNLERLRYIPKKWDSKLQYVGEHLEELIQSVLNCISGFEAIEPKETNSEKYVLRLSRIGQILNSVQGEFEQQRKQLGKSAPTPIFHHLRELELEMTRSRETLLSVGKALQYNGMETSVEKKVLREKFEAAEEELVKLRKDNSISHSAYEDSQKFLHLARQLISTLQKGVPRGGPVLIRTRATHRIVEEDSQTFLEECSRRALRELAEIQSSANRKLIQLKTAFMNLERRIEFLESLFLEPFEKERVAEIKTQLQAVHEETERMKGTNQSAIENTMGMISRDDDLSNHTEETLRTVIKTKRHLSNIGILTGLDTLILTMEGIANEVSAVEVKEIGKDERLMKLVDSITVADVNVLEEKMRPLVVPSKFQDLSVVLNKMKQSIASTTNNNTYLQQHLIESRKVIHKQAKDLRENSELLTLLKESSEKSNKECELFRTGQIAIQRQMSELKREHESTKQKYEQNVKDLVQQRDKLFLNVAVAEKKLFDLGEKHQNAFRKLRERLLKQHLQDKTLLIERVSEEMHRLRCLSDLN